MSDSESDDGDYCPTQNEEKEFEKETKNQKIEEKIEKNLGMSSKQSDAAAAILMSFKGWIKKFLLIYLTDIHYFGLPEVYGASLIGLLLLS